MGTLVTITDAGREALVASGNDGTAAHKVAEIGLAVAPFVADKELLALPSELKRITTFGGANVAADTIHVTLKDDTADQYTLYGFGLYLENGVLLAVYCQPEPILEKSPAAILLLAADLQFATIDAAQLVFGETSFLNPPASTDRLGVIELATQAEVDAGSDDTRAVTPKTAATRYAALSGAIFAGPVQVPTPPTGDHSNLAASTAFARTAVLEAHVGQIVLEPRVSVRAGYLKCNGALVNRSDYPVLWAYAQASGALVSEQEWQSGRWGCFSIGDGAITFRVPELRGEFLRCWADGRDDIDASRQIGWHQGSQNLSHAHIASSTEAGDHVHSAWTDEQGWHAHHGWTVAAGAHNHNNGAYSRLLRPPYGGSLTGSDQAGGGAEQAVGVGDSADIVASGHHAHEFNTDGGANHGHNVGIGAAGRHAHGVTINPDGGNESRPRNIALLAMIRAY
jgi:microcystin-dependent protein